MFRDGDSLNPTSIWCLVYKVFFSYFCVFEFALLKRKIFRGALF